MISFIWGFTSHSLTLEKNYSCTGFRSQNVNRILLYSFKHTDRAVHLLYQCLIPSFKYMHTDYSSILYIEQVKICDVLNSCCYTTFIQLYTIKMNQILCLLYVDEFYMIFVHFCIVVKQLHMKMNHHSKSVL